jgi:hypothetical protein
MTATAAAPALAAFEAIADIADRKVLGVFIGTPYYALKHICAEITFGADID